MALTNKQQMFVKEYLIDLNATQAAIRAGYSEKTANVIGPENLVKPCIAEIIQTELDKRSERTAIDADYVLTTIRDTVERCRQAEEVVDRSGKPVLIENEDGTGLVPAYKFDSGGVLKGCELLGKHLKLFTDKTEITGANGQPIETKWTVEIVKPKEA